MHKLHTLALAAALFLGAAAAHADDVGNVASGAADKGNPVKTGCKYNASQPTVSDGQRVDAQCDANGNARMVLNPATSGGLIFFGSSIAGAVTAVKASAGQLYGWHIDNIGAQRCYLQVFNKTAGNVTLGTTAPDFTIPIVNGTAPSDESLPAGLAFSNGISIAATTTRAGSTGCAMEVSVFYK